MSTENKVDNIKNKRLRINLYLTPERATAFKRAFNLLKIAGILSKDAELKRSRTKVVDHALDALITDLEIDSLQHADLFERTFELLKAKGLVPQSAELADSRSVIVDMALDALIKELDTD